MISAAAKVFQDRHLRRVAIACLILFVLLTALTLHPVYRSLSPRTVSAFFNFTTTLLALAITVLAFLLWREAGWTEILGRVWLYLMAGMFLWTVGEAIWAYYEVILNKVTPYPSVADIAWVFGYIPLVLAMVIRLRSLQTTPERQQTLISTGISAVLAIIALIFVIGPIVLADDYDSRFEQFIDILYPLGDLALAYTAMLCMAALTGGLLSRTWLLIASGFVLLAISDLLFVYTTWKDIYTIKEDGPTLLRAFIDLTYVLGYMLIGYGCYIQARLQRII